MLRVRLDRYEVANRSMATRTTILFVLGGIGAVVAAFGMFLGLAMTAMPDKDEGDGLFARRGGIFLTVFFGLVPAIVSTVMLVHAARQRARFRRLGELAAIARQGSGGITAHDIARGLGTTPQLAERLFVDAASLGLIEHGPSPDAVTSPGPQIVVSPGAATGPPTPALGHAQTLGAPARGHEVAPGVVLGDTYRVEEPLGRGGMGEVFAARHLRTGRRYAVKSILGGPRADEGTFRRFEREATAASALGHPGIVQVHDFNVTPGGAFYLVMDLLEGETLERRLGRGPLPWAAARPVALELCAALGAAHEHGLIHRDIKPSNVFLARSRGAPERAVLVDFGLVKPLDESAHVTSTGMVVGTPMYMSPEQARGEPLDVRSDVYSLAAVIFEAVTGAPPFLDRTLAAVYARLLHEPAPRASDVAQRRLPAGFDDVLARALAKDRAARFATVRAFAQALEGIGAGAAPEEAPATERMAN